MKRFLSLFIALILAFSMFAVTAIAFAEGEDSGNTDDKENVASHKVTFEAEKFKELVYDNQLKVIEMSKTFMLDSKITVKDDEGNDKEVVWYKDYKTLHEIFPGINYVPADEDLVDIKDLGSNPSLDDYKEANVTPWSIFYILELPEGAKVSGNSKADDSEHDEEEDIDYYKFVRYQETQIATLEKAPSVENYKFAGWKLSAGKYADQLVDELKGDFLFAAGFKFNMPKAMIRATAQWEKITTDDDNKEGEEDDSKQPEEFPDVYANDELYILYTSSDSKEEMKDWDRCLVSNTFSVTTAGPWAFRFAVADGMKTSENGHTFDWEDDIMVTTFDNVLDEIEKGELSEQQLLEIDYTLRCFAEDTTNPEVKLSTTMKNKVNEGLTVGTTYSISTALDITDASSTTVTYVVYKFVNGSWLQIYDSKTSEITEGYEDNISKSGVITPLESDVKADKAHVYKIEYKVVDAYGYVGIHVDDDYDEGKLPASPTMLLFVNAKPVAPKKMTAIDAWKIVLYVIAGLSAVGIVVLLFIKPKQETAADARYSASSGEEVDGEQKANNDQQE